MWVGDPMQVGEVTRLGRVPTTCYLTYIWGPHLHVNRLDTSDVFGNIQSLGAPDSLSS